MNQQLHWWRNFACPIPVMSIALVVIGIATTHAEQPYIELVNDVEKKQRPNVMIVLVDDLGSVSYTHLTLPTIYPV